MKLFNCLNKVRKGSDDLSPYGSRSDLLTCGNQAFTELMFDTICDQAIALGSGEWTLHCNARPFALSIIGGSPQACIAVGIGGKTKVRLNTKSITVSCQDIEDEFYRSEIVKSEEGEMMMYAAMRAVFKIGFTHEHSSEGIDCVIELHSDDSDAFAGLGMQAVFNLESTCLLQNRKFTGAIYVRGPRKSVAQVTKLGNIFKTNIQVDHELSPTGRGFEFLVDIIAVYYTLEQDATLPKLPDGHRAILTVAGTFSLVNHDYLRCQRTVD